MLAQEDWSSSGTVTTIYVTEILWATPSSHLEKQSPFNDDYLISGVKDIFLVLSCKKLQQFVKKLILRIKDHSFVFLFVFFTKLYYNESVFYYKNILMAEHAPFPQIIAEILRSCNTPFNYILLQ